MSSRWDSPLRVVQFLLRNADAATESPQGLVDAAASWGANAILLNAGGFSAWYPTRLAYQLANPWLRGDFFGQAFARAQERDLRVLARMDVSKAHPSVAADRPDWLCRVPDGSVRTEWEMPETCFTGDYWQRCNFEMLDELLGTYAVDGVFYNMYRVAHCHCARCQELVRAEGLPGVPEAADPADRDWRAYELWRRRSLVAYTERLRAFLHERRPEAALLVYHHQKEGWDVRGIASASDVVSVTASLPLAVNPLSPQPAWVSWPGYEAALARGLKPGRPGMVVTTTSALFASRRAAQPPDRLRVAQLQVAFQRGGPCPAIPGGLEQDDPRALPGVADTLGWLARHEAAFEGLESPARVVLLASRDTLDLCPIPGEGELSRREEWGIYLALSRARYPFDVVPLDHRGPDLSRYQVALLPDVACLAAEDAAAIDRWVEGGGTLIATYLAGAFDERGETRPRSPLQCLGEPRVLGTLDQPGGYLALGDADLRAALGGPRFIGLEHQLLELEGASPAAVADLQLLGPVPNNTPEFAVVPLERRGPAGLIGRRHGAGWGWHLPWRPGALVSLNGLVDPAALLGWLVERAVGPAPLAILPDSPAVESRLWLQPARNRALLFLLNGAALQLTPMTEVSRLGPMELRVPLAGRRVRSLVRNTDVPFTRTADGMTMSLPWLDLSDALVIEDLESGEPLTTSDSTVPGRRPAWT